MQQEQSDHWTEYKVLQEQLLLWDKEAEGQRTFTEEELRPRKDSNLLKNMQLVCVEGREVRERERAG